MSFTWPRDAGRVLAGATILALVSCATAPPPPRAPGAAAAWLGGSPNVVVRLNATRVKAWADVTGKTNDLKEVGSRTKVVWAGLNLDRLEDLKSPTTPVSVVLEGNFPRTAVSLALSVNGDWKPEASAGVWTNRSLNLSVSLPDEGLVTVRRSDPSAPREGNSVLRDLAPTAVESSDLWVSFWDPGRVLFGETGSRLFAVSRLDLILTAYGDYLEGPMVLTFASDRAAKAGALLLTMFGKQVRDKIGQDLDWTVAGSVVTGATFRITQTDLKLLAAKLLEAKP